MRYVGGQGSRLTRMGSPQDSQYHRTCREPGIGLPGRPKLSVKSLIRAAICGFNLADSEGIPLLPTDG